MIVETIKIPVTHEEEEYVKNFFIEFFSEHYKKEIGKAVLSKERKILLDFSLIEKIDYKIADLILQKPEEIISIAEDVLYFLEPSLKGICRIRIFNIPKIYEKKIRELRSEHLGKLVVVDGIVKRASEIRPEVYEAIYECLDCGSKYNIIQTERTIKKPLKCIKCNSKNFELIGEKLYDARWLVIEEPYELISGERPSSIMVYLKEDLVEPKLQAKTDPGNRIKVIGVLKVIPRKLRRTKTREMETFIDAIYFEPLETEWEEIELNKEDIKKIEEEAKKQDFYEKLVNSIAPTIYGNKEVKEALLLQMVGGNEEFLPDGNRIRGEIHVLLVGDPGTGKSQLLKIISSLAPRAKYVSGKSSSAAGLIATVTRDEEFFGGWVLEAGLVIMANKSVACIDEFEKVDKKDLIALMETMEQGSYSYDFEVFLSNGRRVKIGKLVDYLMEKYKDKVKKFEECEILDLDNLENIKLFTTDFKNVYEIKVKNVSRHFAPKNLIKITFSNGREIEVTEDHPFFIFTLNGIKTVYAKDLKIGNIILSPKILPLESKTIEFKKSIALLAHNDKDFYRFLGYLLSDGYISENEIIFSNSNKNLIEDYIRIFKKLFNKDVYVWRNKKTGTINVRCRDKEVIEFLKENVKEIFEKRIPSIVFTANKEDAKEIVKGLFFGDGHYYTYSKNKEKGKIRRIVFSFAEKLLAYDLQDLLLYKFGIYSKIRKEKNVFRVVIERNEDILKFENLIGKNVLSKDINPNKINSNIEKMHIIVRKLSNLVGKGENQFLNFNFSLIKGKMISKKSLEKFKENFLEYVKNSIEKLKECKNLKEWIIIAKESFGISNSIIAKELNVSHQLISYWLKKNRENKLQKVKDVLQKIINEKIRKIELYLNLIDLSLSFNFVKVKKIEKVEYDKKYVYDIRVEPTQSFVSQALILHNSISIAKASIVATLPAKTAILAAANPKYGRFDPYIPIKEQIDIPEVLLSRFDLKFVLKDVPNIEEDAKIIEHIKKTRYFNVEELKNYYDKTFIKKFIAYARKFKPQMTEEAYNEIAEFYKKMREKAKEGAPISITLRQLEGLIRLAQASAKIRLSNKVEKIDAQRAINLMLFSLKQFGFDPTSGMIDIDLAEGRLSASQRGKIRIVRQIIDELEKIFGNMIPEEEIIKRAKEANIDNIEEILNKMKLEGELITHKPGFVGKVWFTIQFQ